MIKTERTKRLDQQDPYLRECESQVLAVLSDESEISSLGGAARPGSFCLCLDRTVFFPEGGGQLSDIGGILDLQLPQTIFEVFHVFETDGIVYHQIAGEASKVLALADRNVRCVLNWERRFSNMQRHCGEHILSAVLFEKFGGVNRGFHMGLDYMTIDIALEGEEVSEALTDDDMRLVEWEANQMIWDNLPVTRRFFETKETAETVPMRKALAIEKDITLVGIGDLSYGAGTVACCGTHPKRTGEVGLIKIYKREAYKGMFRITFDAGSVALSSSRAETDLVRHLCRRYSAEPETIIDRLVSLDDKKNELRQELYDLKKSYIQERADEILASSQTAGKNAGTILIREYPVLKTDDLLAIGRLLPKERAGLLILINPNEYTAILFSGGTPDCGKLIRDNAAVWSGKGGGKTDNARALFPSRQDLDCFLDFLKKAHGRNGG